MKIARLRALTQHSHKCVDQERIRRNEDCPIEGIDTSYYLDSQEWHKGRNEDCPTEGTRISMKTKSSISSIKRRDAFFTEK